MTERVVSSWETVAWDESTYDEHAGCPPLIRADVKRKLIGDLEGNSEAVLLCCRPDEKSAGYVATERVDGTLMGRSGTFVLQHAAAMGGPQPARIGFVVPNSATGELAGLRGECVFDHDEDGRSVLRLTYDLDALSD